MGVIIVREMVGTSPDGWSDAARKAQAGAELYEQYACITCHGTGKGPPFVDLYGSKVKLTTGETGIADDAYLRESILFPTAQIVAGYKPIMPTFKGQLTEDQVLDLIAYNKSLQTQERTSPQ